MTDTATATRKFNPPWECSAAFEQTYGEYRGQAAQLLHEWGSYRNQDWPDGGRFIRITSLAPTVHWFKQITEIGRRGVTRAIPGWKLTELFPHLDWPQHTLDVWFIVPHSGNVRKGRSYPRELMGYILHPDTIRIVHLGCDHPHRELTKSGNCYREWTCTHCGYVWGEDSSG